MKRAKKLASLLLAMVMVFSMTMAAYAAEGTHTISVPAAAEGAVAHTYEVYQIFTGKLSEGSVLSNLVWGLNGTGTEGEEVEADVLTALENVDKNASDGIKLATIKNYVNLDSEAYATVASGSSLTDVPAGYYLIKDVDASLAGKDDAYTTYIVEIVDDVTVSPKSAKPEVDKQVLDEVDDAEAGAVDGWGETADHGINESFQFKLIATLSADTDYAAYETYKVVFNDTMSAGVTFESIESVTVNGTAITDYTCTATEGQEGGSWTLTIEDLKEHVADLSAGAVVEVIYNAHLNENAGIGDTDVNNNTVYLQYSNNPNASGSGSGGSGDEDDDDDLGQTEEDTVWVFTYEMPNKKIDGTTKEALADAGFRLYDADGNEVALIKDTELGAYRPVKDGETAEEMKSAEDGTFKIVGLDAGTYTLKETTTPAGYNTCDPITIVITATHAEDASETTANTTISMTQDGTETSENVIENNKGTVLPETGGMGTTIFYALGSVLVLGAVIVMVTRKRMSNR